MSYRQREIQKRVGGKIRRYKNFGAFIRECPKRVGWTNVCHLTNIRRLKDGSGLATVKVEPMGTPGRKGSTGTWLLHFADYSVLKGQLKGRVDPARAGMLDGARRRRR